MNGYTVSKTMITETAHRLINYSGKCAHLHGHSYQWTVTAAAEELDHQGFVLDFGQLKEAMVEVIDKLDHAMVLCASRDEPLVLQMFKNHDLYGSRVPVHYPQYNNLNADRIALLDPPRIGVAHYLQRDLSASTRVHGRVYLMDRNPTAENFAKYAFYAIEDRLIEWQNDYARQNTIPANTVWQAPPIRVSVKEVEVRETANSRAVYSET